MSASSGLWKDRTMMTIDPARSLLLVIDFQVRLMPAIHEGELAVRNARRLTDAAALMGIPCLFTEQNAKGLGPTVDELMVPQDRLVHKQFFDACREEETSLVLVTHNAAYAKATDEALFMTKGTLDSA